MTHAAGYTRPRRHGGLPIIISALILLAIPSSRADFVDPFATVCSKQAEDWHKLEIDAGRALIACSNEFATQEPTLCGYIGAEGNCTQQPDCDDGGVAKVECPAGASRGGGCCLIPKIFDCGGPNGTCMTTNGGPKCQNTCEKIPLPPAPAPGPMDGPMEAPDEAPFPAQAPVPAPVPAPMPAPTPAPAVEEPAVGPAAVPEVVEEPAVGPSEMTMAEAPAAVAPEAEGPVAAPEEVDAGTSIGTRDIGLAPVAAAPESVEDDAARADSGGRSAASWAAAAAGGITAFAAVMW